MTFKKKTDPGYTPMNHKRGRKPQDGKPLPGLVGRRLNDMDKVAIVVDYIVLGKAATAVKWNRSTMTVELAYKRAQKDLPLWEKVQEGVDQISSIRMDETKRTVKRVGAKQSAAIERVETIRLDQAAASAELLLTATLRMKELVEDPNTDPAVVLATIKTLTDRAAADAVTASILGENVTPLAQTIYEADAQEVADDKCVN